MNLPPIDSTAIDRTMYDISLSTANHRNSSNQTKIFSNFPELIDEAFCENSHIDANKFPDPQLVEDLPKTPAQTHFNTEIVSILKDKKAAVHLKEFDGVKDLVILVYHILLLKEIKDANGRSILHVALERNDLPMIKLIIALAPDLLGCRIDGKTPLHIAVENRASTETIKWLTIKARLLNPTATQFALNVNTQDDLGNTALHYALKLTEWKLAFQLKDLGADETIENNLKLTSAEMGMSALYDLHGVPNNMPRARGQILQNIQSLEVLINDFL